MAHDTAKIGLHGREAFNQDTETLGRQQWSLDGTVKLGSSALDVAGRAGAEILGRARQECREGCTQLEHHPGPKKDLHLRQPGAKNFLAVVWWSNRTTQPRRVVGMSGGEPGRDVEEIFGAVEVEA